MRALYVGKPEPAVLDYLLHRRNAKKLGEPGPDDAQIERILRAASRVPDHGKLAPWRFILFKGDARKEAGEILRQAWRLKEPDATPAKLDLEAERFLNAPVIIAVVSTISEGKIPEWEQILSAGAACMALILAANASGFATNWLTRWYSYDDYVLQKLGIAPGDRIAGFIHIGTALEQPEERERPDLQSIVKTWPFDK